MAVQWEKVYVFISSTFNDMHAERDYLVKQVFPRLQEWCERRKLRLVDIDLRWGVTEADASQNKRVVHVCLERIDACRPFFVCLPGPAARLGAGPGRHLEVHLLRLSRAGALRRRYICHRVGDPARLCQPAAPWDGWRRVCESGSLILLPAATGIPGITPCQTRPNCAQCTPTRPAPIPPRTTPRSSIGATRRSPAQVARCAPTMPAGTPERAHPEIRLTLQCPSTAKRGSDAWKAALSQLVRSVGCDWRSRRRRRRDRRPDGEGKG